mmetsp:Transcript_131779/g.256657  ORF Transcript_131779/g.256657 Transcript_131779/m.256657 type:complete len:276 (-) Transcript_131779:100-927(-)
MGAINGNCCSGRGEPRFQDKAACQALPPEQPLKLHSPAPEPEPESLNKQDIAVPDEKTLALLKGDQEAMLPRSSTMDEPAGEPSRENTDVTFATAVPEAAPDKAPQASNEAAYRPPPALEAMPEAPTDASSKHGLPSAAQNAGSPQDNVPNEVSVGAAPLSQSEEAKQQVLPEESGQPLEEGEREPEVTKSMLKPSAQAFEEKAVLEETVEEDVLEHETTSSILPTSVLPLMQEDTTAEPVEATVLEQEARSSVLPASALQPENPEADNADPGLK